MVWIERRIAMENEDYKRGYQQALKDINTSQKMIQERWESSICPTCHTSFHEYEECDDGYYKRACSLERCPYCGQSITWN